MIWRGTSLAGTMRRCSTQHCVCRRLHRRDCIVDGCVNGLQQKMEMTTPVFTTAGQASREGKMAFVMEAKLGNNPDKFPTPRDSRLDTGIQEWRMQFHVQPCYNETFIRAITFNFMFAECKWYQRATKQWRPSASVVFHLTVR